MDILENLEPATSDQLPEEDKKNAREKLHIAASLAGVAITNSCTGIVHSYDHPGPAFSLPHGTVCGIMLPYSMECVGPHPSYAEIARRLGYRGTQAELSTALQMHLYNLMKQLSFPVSFQQLNIHADSYFEHTGFWSDISLNAFATQMSPAHMTKDKGLNFYEHCYYGL